MQNEITTFLTGALTEGWIPGFAVVFAGNGKHKIRYSGNKALCPKKEKLTIDSIYDIASLTKVIVTTTLVLQLVAEKKITFDAKVKQYISEFCHSDITILDLLLHRSGLPADRVLNSEWPIEVYKKELYHTPLDEKGKVQYSDIGFILLGWIVESVTGESLSDLSNRKIIKPLNLKNTGYRLERPEEQFVPTEKRSDSGLRRGVVHDRKATYLKGISGHAGLFTTIEDVAIILNSLLSNDSIVFPADYRTLMMEYAENGRTLGWEWRKSSNGDEYLYHTGFTGVFMYVNLTENSGGAVLTNSIHPYRDDMYKERRNQLINRLFEEGLL
ncbi:serine hydrolase domain-containing protein [Desemzia incerta]|uniref:serine hydrolase domain-containing protein n=1 Tax=Desemzia incerta TaxID=82801 RepID=UPI0024C2763C|nr:serine hydrolase domain-containing protein [Desemzia incerta]WHZ32886.1 serine hydrolase domain-containing protein [Desemzia incerta]